MSEELYFTPISKGNISILKFYCKCKTETHPLAPITVGLPASNNETVIANIPRERQAACFPGITSVDLDSQLQKQRLTTFMEEL